MSPSRASRRSAALAVVCGCLSSAAAQTPRAVADPLTSARARQEISDQKAQADVLDALRDAERLARISPVRAALRLKGAQDAIDLSAAISGEARKNFSLQIQSRLAALDARSAPATVGLRNDPNAQGAREARAGVLEAARKEAAAIEESLKAIARDQASNRAASATGRIDDLRAKYPNNPAVLALAGRGTIASRLADSRELAAQQDKRVVLALNDVSRSALPALGDIEFPRDWKERTKRRLAEVELSAREKAILQSLDAPMTYAARERPFEEVIQDLSNRMGQEIFVDNKSLQDAGLDLKKPVSITGKEISGRTYLRQILAGQGLTFVVQGEVIKVVTVEKAREMLVARVYYLGDLVQGVGPFGGAVQWGPLLDYEQTNANVKVVIDAIVNTIDPLSWKANGGPGTVTFHFPSMSLIVRASSEVHATLGGRLGKGK